MSEKSGKESRPQADWSPNINKLHKSQTNTNSGTGSREKSTKND